MLNDAALSEVPVGAVVRAADGTIAARFDVERGVVFGAAQPFPWQVLRAPAQLLWSPSGATSRTDLERASEAIRAVRDLCASVGRGNDGTAAVFVDDVLTTLDEALGGTRDA